MRRLKKVVWDCGVDKAPGPDGFTFGFYRRYWNLIESDVVNAVKWIFIHGSIPKGGNSCFITLIPKIPNANMVKDFRPISLVGSVYKIVAKILANRLVTVLGDLVNEIQSAFMTDRQILDGLFILNELVQWCKKRKKQVMFFKVDFEKAYDSVRWEFLDDILKKFGFGKKWCNWIQSCLQFSRGSVLVNGSPTQEFQFYKGLKQGDPLSPFLFILVMESLHVSFQRVVDAGLFKGIKMGSSLQISHLFYADDAIFMGHWNQSNISMITRVLDVFHRASGLRINMNKSKLMGISVDDSMVEQAAAKIGCVVLKTPFKYLGSRVGGLMSRVQSWNEIIEGMEARLSRWKLKTLSIGGRLTLLKSVLGAIHIYPLHGEGGKIGKLITSTYPSIWLSIVQEVETLKRQGIDLMSFITPSLGNGLDTSFGDVPWRGDIAFKELAPRIYALESMKGITVALKLKRLKGCILIIRKLEVTWSLDGVGDFTVASVRKAIDDHILPTGNTNTRWVKEVPIKINIHAWKVKMIVSLPGLTCLDEIIIWWELDHREIDSYDDWLEWVTSIRLPIKVKKVFEGICYIVWWYTWNWRNKKIFGHDTP
ncbi:RNA-directed DNA polymerase, eukaryota, partial [Tanacetum coccineum]